MIKTFRANSNSLTFLFNTFDEGNPSLCNSVGDVLAFGDQFSFKISEVGDMALVSMYHPGDADDLYPMFTSDPFNAVIIHEDSEDCLSAKAMARIFCQRLEDLYNNGSAETGYESIAEALRIVANQNSWLSVCTEFDGDTYRVLWDLEVEEIGLYEG